MIDRDFFGWIFMSFFIFLMEDFWIFFLIWVMLICDVILFLGVGKVIGFVFDCWVNVVCFGVIGWLLGFVNCGVFLVLRVLFCVIDFGLEFMFFIIEWKMSSNKILIMIVLVIFLIFRKFFLFKLKEDFLFFVVFGFGIWVNWRLIILIRLLWVLLYLIVDWIRDWIWFILFWFCGVYECELFVVLVYELLIIMVMERWLIWLFLIVLVFVVCEIL